jgi:hypothetical protein
VKLNSWLALIYSDFDSAVCKAALPFNDPLPEDVFEKLFTHLHAEHTALKGELDADPTYATAARCFLNPCSTTAMWSA